MFPWYLPVHATFIKVPHDLQELPYTNDEFDATMTKIWILTKTLWVLAILFYDEHHEDSTEEI